LHLGKSKIKLGVDTLLATKSFGLDTISTANSKVNIVVFFIEISFVAESWHLQLCKDLSMPHRAPHPEKA
jgi:hypothetical protein